MEVVEDLKDGGIWIGFPQRVVIRMSSNVPRGKQIAIAYGTNNDDIVFIVVYKR